jgi:hypothetical protein
MAPVAPDSTDIQEDWSILIFSTLESSIAPIQPLYRTELALFHFTFFSCGSESSA